MSNQIIILDSDPLVVYSSSDPTNASSTEMWSHETWSINGSGGTFATTSSSTGSLSLQIPEPVIGFEYWGFLHNTPGACFIGFTSSSGATTGTPIFAEGNPGLPVMLFSTQLAAPAAPSVFLGNIDAPALDFVSFVLILPSSTGDGGLPTATISQGQQFLPTNSVNVLSPQELTATSEASMLPTPQAGIVPTVTFPSPQESFSPTLQFTPFTANLITTPGPPILTPSAILTLLPFSSSSPPITSTSLSKTPSAKATSLPALTSSTHASNRLAGKIAGGVVGGIAFLAILFGLLYYRTRRQRREKQKHVELDSPESRRSIISSESSDVITPFPPVPRPASVPEKLGGREPQFPSRLEPVRPIPYGVKPSQMRPSSLPTREEPEGAFRPGYVLPRAKHASLPRPTDEGTSSTPGPSRNMSEISPGDNGSSSHVVHDLPRVMGPRRAVDGGPLALGAARDDGIVTSPPTY